LDRPVGTVIVGNPDIADVTVQSEKIVVLTAKKLQGNTNLIVLDTENNDLLKADIFVGV
jgi:Flp pilus assembly secretin CpaC